MQDDREFVKEVNYSPPMATFEYRVIGPAVDHNYLCAVCRKKAAVIETWSGILQPCWECQKSYKLVKLNWFLRLFIKE